MAKLLKKFTLKLLALSINVQLIASPIAFAQDDGLPGGDSATTQPKEGKSKFWSTTSKITETAMGALDQGLNMINGQANPMQNLLAKPINPAQLPPALQAAGCLVFEARTESPSTNMCEPSVAGEANIGESLALLSTAQSNVNEFENYLVNANESQTSQGKACLNKAMLNLQAQLKARVESLNQFEKLIEDTIKNTKKLTEADLDALRKGDALLNGKAKDEKNNSLADFDFGKQFKSQSCSSFMQESDLSDIGNKGGYRAIEEMLSKNFESSEGKNDAYSPKELFGNESLIKKDIDDLLANFENNITNIDAVDMKPEEVFDGAQTSIFPEGNKSVTNILKNELKDYKRKMSDKRKQLKGIPKETLALIESGSETSADAAAVYKRQQYNACLSGYVGDGKAFAKSITNFTLSRNADKNRDSLLRTTVYENLMDDEIGIDQKIQNISQYDKSANEKIRMGSSQTLCGTNIYADTRVSVSQLMSLYKCECEKQYNAKSSGQSLSAQQVENQLSGYSMYIRNSKTALAQKLKTEVKDKVLNCPQDNSTGIGSLSCDKALNKTSNNFCLRTAKMCAGNMKACFDQANQILVQTRTEQKNIAARYTAHMDDLKAKLQTAFINNSKNMEAVSRTLDGQYQVGSVYNVPLNTQMDQLKEKFVEGLDPSLKIEDPDAYLEIMKKDIAIAKDSLKKSNKEIFGADVDTWTGLASSGASSNGFLGKISGYIKNVELEKDRWSKIEDKCLASISEVNRQRDEENKRRAEANEKQQELYSKQVAHCREIEALSQNGCHNIGVSSIVMPTLQATSATTGSDYSSAVKDLCNNYDDKLANIQEDTEEEKLSRIQDECGENGSKCKNLPSNYKVISACYGDDLLDRVAKATNKNTMKFEFEAGTYTQNSKGEEVELNKISYKDLEDNTKIYLRGLASCPEFDELEKNESIQELYVSIANNNYKDLGEKAVESNTECKSLLAGSRNGGDKTDDVWSTINRSLGSLGGATNSVFGK